MKRMMMSLILATVSAMFLSACTSESREDLLVFKDPRATYQKSVPITPRAPSASYTLEQATDAEKMDRYFYYPPNADLPQKKYW